MGSSFNTTDRLATLREAHRILKSPGWFACLWNHRELDRDPIQAKAEAILKDFFPDYSHGTRREDQSDLLSASPYFRDLHYIEVPHNVEQRLDDYIAAWKSVKNKFWDLRTPEGRALFARIEDRFRQELDPVMHLTYTTRIWMIRKW
jgi:hypothetical protein